MVRLCAQEARQPVCLPLLLPSEYIVAALLSRCPAHRAGETRLDALAIAASPSLQAPETAARNCCRTVLGRLRCARGCSRRRRRRRPTLLRQHAANPAPLLPSSRDAQPRSVAAPHRLLSARDGDGTARLPLLSASRSSGGASPPTARLPALKFHAGKHRRWSSSRLSHDAAAADVPPLQPADAAQKQGTAPGNGAKPPASQPAESEQQPAAEPAAKQLQAIPAPAACAHQRTSVHREHGSEHAIQSAHLHLLREPAALLQLPTDDRSSPSSPHSRCHGSSSRGSRGSSRLDAEPPPVHAHRGRRYCASTENEEEQQRPACALAAAHADLAAARALAAHQARQLSAEAHELQQLHAQLPAARRQLLDAQARLHAAHARLAAARHAEQEAGHARAKLATLHAQLPREHAAAAAALRRARHELEAWQHEEAAAEGELQEAEVEADTWRRRFNRAVVEHRPAQRVAHRPGAGGSWLARMPFFGGLETTVAVTTAHRSPPRQ